MLSAVLAFESNQALFARRMPPAPEAPVLDPAMLVSVPLFHVTGSNAIFLTAFRPGRKLVLMYKWNAEEALSLIERERVTAFTGVPTMTWEMLQCENFDQYDTSSLQSIGGEAPAPRSRFVGSRRASRAGRASATASRKAMPWARRTTAMITWPGPGARGGRPAS